MSTTNIKTPLFGALFENEKKKEGTKSPDFTGTLGEDKTLFISAWYDESHESLSLKVSQKTNDGFVERGNGTLGTNAEKKSENQPDVKGEITIDETSYDIAGWNKLAKTSQKAYISLKVSEPRAKGDAKPATSANTSKPQVKEDATPKNRYESNKSADKDLNDIFDFSE